MKTTREKRIEDNRKYNKKIWKSLRIEVAIKTYGFDNVKSAISQWLNYQRENAKLLREKRALESKLAEIEKKI